MSDALEEYFRRIEERLFASVGREQRRDHLLFGSAEKIGRFARLFAAPYGIGQFETGVERE